MVLMNDYLLSIYYYLINFRPLPEPEQQTMMEPNCSEKIPVTPVDLLELESRHLGRSVRADIYISSPSASPHPVLLLVNDGQNMEELRLDEILQELANFPGYPGVVAVAIHAGPDRKLEYGTAGYPDYLNRGNKADAYTQFIFEELLPAIRQQTGISAFREKWFAGFSLGGLSALDIVWAHPHEFTRVGVFSGSLWWRSLDQDDPAYSDDQHRIMHQLIRTGHYAPWLKFFFETGTLDETSDRNKNGIIDSIDDTLDLMAELEKKGYKRDSDMVYLELPQGRHDIATWAEAMPVFLRWAVIGSR